MINILRIFRKIFCAEDNSDPVSRACGEWVRSGCSPAAAALVRTEYRRGRIDELSALAAVQELQYCNDIDELKERFAVTGRPAGRARDGAERLDAVFGAIYGDIIGSKYEGRQIADISDAVSDPMQPACRLTDDSLLTYATLYTLCGAEKAEYCRYGISYLDIRRESSYPIRYNPYTDPYRSMAVNFPLAGYGSRFIAWAESCDDYPYGSLGNGSAMRVSPVGAWCDDIGDVIEQAAVSAMSTHNHIEGVKGAVVTAVCVWMARNGYSKEQIFAYMKKHYSYGASTFFLKNFSYKEASSIKVNQVECSYSVPAAVISFFESRDFMDAIRLSACVGFDTDTNACICGAIAGAYYGISDDVRRVVIKKASETFGRNVFGSFMIGDRIARLRKENGYSAEQAAEKAGMPLKKYLNIENCAISAEAADISRIAAVYGADPEEITAGAQA